MDYMTTILYYTLLLPYHQYTTIYTTTTYIWCLVVYMRLTLAFPTSNSIKCTNHFHL
jgi:hypothetical protein